MNRLRSRRARTVLRHCYCPTPATESEAHVNSEPVPKQEVPSTALIGLSLIGNLDAIYTSSSSSKIKLKQVSTASKQRPGGMLLLEHTFNGKLWFDFVYDENAFRNAAEDGDSGGLAEQFWESIGEGVEELLR